MPAPTVVTQASAGQSQISGTDGALITEWDVALIALGWTKEYSGTNKAAYKQGSGTGYYLRVVDAAADHSADARRAYIEIYSSMSDVDTGTKIMGDVAEEYYIVKSDTADATGHDWELIGNDNCFYWGVKTNSGTGSAYIWHFIGDLINEEDSGDTNTFAVSLDHNAGTSSSTKAGMWRSGFDEIYFAEDRAGTSNGVEGDFAAHQFSGNPTTPPNFSAFFNNTGPYPGPTGRLWACPVRAVETAGDCYRGRFPGILFPLSDLFDDATLGHDSVILSADQAGGVFDVTLKGVAHALRPTNLGITNTDLICFDIDDGALW
jgi:hypothetical protein